MLLALLIAAQTYGPQHLPPVTDSEDPLVDVAEIVPGLIVHLAYARADNIVGRALYPADAKCWLRRSVAHRVATAADALRKQGFRLVARDCTRSLAAQRALWKAHPHPGAVADPARGSLHARGVAVDLELADPSGAPLRMPTPFDDFGPDAAADAPLPEGPLKQRREALKTAMHAAGFRVNPKEWWHYSRLYGWRWPVASVR
jgi:D-alanyl-D-alanine dipeptidase